MLVQPLNGLQIEALCWLGEPGTEDGVHDARCTLPSSKDIFGNSFVFQESDRDVRPVQSIEVDPRIPAYAVRRREKKHLGLDSRFVQAPCDDESVPSVVPPTTHEDDRALLQILELLSQDPCRATPRVFHQDHADM